MHTLRLKLEMDKNTAYITEKRFRILAHISNQIRKHVKKLPSREIYTAHFSSYVWIP